MGLLLHTPRARLRRRARQLLRRDAGPSVLAGRRVLVTGASSGIGEAAAMAAAARGATVLLVARRQAELERVQQAIEEAGGDATIHVCDMTDVADGGAVDALIAEVLARHGGVDYLVNNAGRSIRRSVALSYDRFHDVERTMAVNFFGPVRLTLGVLPSMRAQQFGHVVNVVSTGVQLKATKFSAYFTSKIALDSWSRMVGRETYGDNVTFTNMRFALVRTPMTAPTQALYDALPSISAEVAAERIVRALEERPLTVGTFTAGLGEWFNLATPRLSDALYFDLDRRYDDTPAARGGTGSS